MRTVAASGAGSSAQAPVRGDEQVQPGELVEQPARPAAAGGDDAGQPPHRGGRRRRLGVDEPGRGLLEPRVPLALGAREAAAHLVAQPALEVVEPGGHAGGPLLGPPPRRLDVLDLAHTPNL